MRSRLGTVVALFSVLLWACNTQAQWTYPIDPAGLYGAPSGPSRLTVAVFPFKEERPVKNRSATMWIYLIPGAPYGWVNYERPEAARTFNTIAEYGFQMDEDLGKAATRSLEESRLFQRVYFTLGGEIEEADLILRGSTRRTRYRGTLITYGLSAYGPLLWLFGFPAGVSKNETELTLSLQDKSNREVWTGTYKGSKSITQGLYYNFGNDTLNFAVLVQEAMNQAIKDLQPLLPELEAAIGDRE